MMGKVAKDNLEMAKVEKNAVAVLQFERIVTREAFFHNRLSIFLPS